MRSVTSIHLLQSFLSVLVSLLSIASPSSAQSRIAEPIQISFQTIDGSNLTGEVRTWDTLGFDGSFGRIEWKQLDAGEAWHVHAALIDPNLAEHWLSVGQVMSKIDGGQDYARRALNWASWLARRTAEAAEKISNELPPTPDDFVLPVPQVHREEHKPLIKPWADMNDQERSEAVAQLKGEIDGGLKALGITMMLYEQDFALVYTDLPHEQVRSIIIGLATTYETLLKSFRLPVLANVFWGKSVVIICKDEKTFATISRRLFDSIVAPGMAGHHIPRGSKSYLVMWQVPDLPKFQATIAHEFTHAFMHRYRTNGSLPLWMEEGFADYVASLVLKNSPIQKVRGTLGEWFIRTDGPVDNILEMQCLQEGWPGPHQVCYGVSFLLVQEMFRENSTKALACITAIKDGNPWEPALVENLGISRAQLVERLSNRVRNSP